MAYTKEQGKAYREKNKEKISAQRKGYYEENKEKIAAQRKVYHEENKEKIAAQRKGYYEENKEKVSAQQKVYHEENKEKIAAQRKVYHQENKEQRAAYNKVHYLKNKEKIKAYKKVHYLKNKEKIKAYKKVYRKENKEEITAYRRERYKNDPNFKMRTLLRSRLRKVLKGNTKTGPTMKLVGCTVAELWLHIEGLFEPGMTRENNGNGEGFWHLDHKIPCCSFDFSDPEQQKICFHYTNLQPLWCKDNLAKGAKYNEI